MKTITSEEYFDLALTHLAGHRQPLVARDSMNRWYLGGKIYADGDKTFYKDYVELLHNTLGIPNFERDMELVIVDPPTEPPHLPASDHPQSILNRSYKLTSVSALLNNRREANHDVP